MKPTTPIPRAHSPLFTSADVEQIIAVAQEAPLKNMKAASALSNTLQRFQIWAQAQFEHVCTQPEVPAGTPEPTE